MIQDRIEYRKSFNSSGQLYVAGELLDFISYDVSVKGILIEIIPGSLLSEISDFKALLKENNRAEIYVKDLMLTGAADIAWAKSKDGKIQLGLEFRDVMYNAERLWRKRNYYRSSKDFSGFMIANDKRIDFQGVDISVDGLAVQVAYTRQLLKQGDTVKLVIDDLDFKALGRVIWINTLMEHAYLIGLRYFTID